MEHGSQTKKKRDNDDVPPHKQLRINNIAEREAAMKAAEDFTISKRLLHNYIQLYPNVGFDSRPGHTLFAWIWLFIAPGMIIEKVVDNWRIN